MGRARRGFRDAGAGDGGARERRQRDVEGLQPELEVEPPDHRVLHARPEGALPQAVSRRRHLPHGGGQHGAECRLRQPLSPGRRPRAGYRLRAERRGDEWILNGEKTFIANGSVGRLFFVNTRTNPDVPIRDGTTTFLVPVGTPGMRIGKIFNKNGWSFYQNAELVFEDARVPHANVVGEVNGGMKVRSGKSAEFNDFELAANALGVCDAACEYALRHARSARRGGRLLIDHQLVQLGINEMHALTETLRSYMLRTAWEMDHHVKSVNPVLVMNYSTNVIQRVTRLNLEIHAGTSGAMDAMAHKLVRDAIIWSHLAGDTSQRLKAVRRMLRT
jgi:alkylation response protein AidB-like acyl-CoA dehydrogenase